MESDVRYTVVNVHGVEAIHDEATESYMTQTHVADRLNALEAERNALREALETVHDQIAGSPSVERGIGGMTIEASIARTTYRVPALILDVIDQALTNGGGDDACAKNVD